MMDKALPARAGPAPKTTHGMPHMQIGVEPDPEILAELFRRSFSLPDVENRPTVISLPGARALWLAEGVDLVRPEAIVAGREFAHIHPDGSLHASLHPSRANEAVETGWAELHPIAIMSGNEGLVMLFTPQTMAELAVIFQLIVDSYNFITGREVDAQEISHSSTE